jgi:putative hemolysin
VLANGIFAGAEIAVVSLRRSRLKQLLEEGKRGAAAAERLRGQPERFLATVQVGITVVGSTAAAFGGRTVADAFARWLETIPLVDQWARGLSLALVVALVSYLSIVLGELVPKSLALRGAERYALFIAQPLLALSWIARPLVWILTKSSNLLLRPFGDRTTFTETRFSAEELQIMVEEAAKTGSVDEQIGEIASRALEFGELTTADVMVPRNQIHAIPINATADEVKRILLEEAHSRMPVYQGSIDHIVGYISVKDVLSMVFNQQLVVLADLVRPAYFVPESAKASAVLRELQQRRMRLAIVVDEHGVLSGLITVEDLLEELVGELFSEHRSRQELLRREPSGAAVVRGNAPIREINRAMDLELPESDAWTTVAGLTAALAGRIPGRGARVELKDGTTIEVLEASPHLVRVVRIVPPPSPEEPASEQPSAPGP